MRTSVLMNFKLHIAVNNYFAFISRRKTRDFFNDMEMNERI